MDLASEKRFHRLMGQVLALPAEARSAWLTETCGSDTALRQALEAAARPGDAELDSFFDALADEPPSYANGNGIPRESDSSLPVTPLASHPQAVRTTAPLATSVSTGGSTARTGTPIPTTSPLRRLRQQPGAWAFGLLVLLALALVTAAAVGAATLLRGVDPQFTFGSVSGRIVAAYELWPQLHVGDLIREVQGTEVDGDPARIRSALLAIEPGPLTLRIRRGDEERAVTATVRAFSTPQRIVLWTRVGTGTLLLLIGIASFALRPDHRAAGYFLAFCSSLGLHLLGYLALLARPTEGLIVESIGIYLAAATGLHLFACYPQRLLARPWITAFYLPSLTAIMLEVGSYLLPALRGALGSTIQAGNIYAALTAIGSLALAVLQLRRARQRAKPSAIARSRALLVAMILGLVLPSALNATQIVDATFHWALSSFPVIVFAVITAYSIVRHNAFEVDRFTAAVVGYSMTTLLLGTLFVLLVVGVPAWLSSAGWLASPVAAAMVTGLFFLVFHPLYRRVRSLIDRWFERQPMEQAREVQLLRNLASSVRKANQKQVFADAVETVQRLKLERAEVWTRSADQKAFVRALSDVPETVDSSSPEPAREEANRVDGDGVLSMALEQDSGGIAGFTDVVFDVEAQEELWHLGLVLAVPIRTASRLEGFVGVGRKQSGAPLTAENRVFLEAVASQLAIAFERTWQHERMGPYRLRHRLGTGGMAEVLLAEKLGPGGFEREVAIKRLLPHLAQEADCIDMFLDEARIAAQLRHPNIVQIYDIEDHDDNYFLAMEYMDGPTLASLLHRSGARRRRSPVLSPTGRMPRDVPLPVVAAIASALLGALAYAHRGTDRQGRPLGLIHRDVKPANILTSRQGDLKLADFGIAKAEFRLYQTQGDKIRGTPAYMAPEQAARQPAVQQSDLFSAAAVLYETLTLRRAFPRGATEAHLAAGPPELHLPRHPDLQQRLAPVFERAFQPSPEDRYVDAEEMRDALLAALAVTPASPEDVAAWISTLEASTASVQRSRLHQALHLQPLAQPLAGPDHEEQDS